ncbi:MAG: TrmB family transcriptional regulator, partial [Candidatus Diapherotrites archaeon]|nr:TrmB family transcriptional regulator [Candidatus Diapherotrites archaeon]
MDEHIVELIKSSFSKIFTDFGENQAKAYATLLGRGSMTAFEISKESGIPRGRIYDTLTELERKKLIESQESNPKQFFIINTNETIEQAFQTKTQEIETTKKELLNQLTQIEQNQDHEVKDIFKLIKVESVEHLINYHLKMLERSKNDTILACGGIETKYFATKTAENMFLDCLKHDNTIKIVGKLKYLLPKLINNIIKLKRTNETLTYIINNKFELHEKEAFVNAFIRSNKEVIITIFDMIDNTGPDIIIHIFSSPGKTCKFAQKLENDFNKVWENSEKINFYNLLKK